MGTFTSFGLLLTAPPVLVPNESDFEAFGTSLDLPPPPSFRAFLLAHGYGLSADFFVFFTVSRAGSPCTTASGNQSPLREMLRDFSISDCPARETLGREKLISLVPFGETENGDVVAWDRTVCVDHEPRIVVVGSRGFFATIVDGGLRPFFQRILSTGLHDNDRPFPAVFSPMGASRGVVNCRSCDQLVVTLDDACYRCANCGYEEGFPPLTSEQHDAVLDATTAFLLELVRLGDLELVPGVDTTATCQEIGGIVAESFAESRPLGAQGLVDLLLRHAAVEDVYISDEDLERKLRARQSGG